uniref:Photosystem I reaction center subunit II n=1 Tax=Nitophyllum punctatum TaxID=158729 RepID=A0A4D6X1I9_9FLOR|nr:photosystem I reaction center subunit II [Nitophyllum punctatum]
MNNTIDFKIPSPTFGGSTGGWLRAAEIEEKYAITWTSEKQQIFEMPTGGSAIMAESANLLYLAKKEQCLALSAQLKAKFKITEFKIYRIFPSGEVQYLHPKDGVFPEKVNPGRVGIGNILHNIGQNSNPINKKFTGEATYE